MLIESVEQLLVLVDRKLLEAGKRLLSEGEKELIRLAYECGQMKDKGGFQL